MKRYRKGAAGYPPLSDHRHAWPTLNRFLCDDMTAAVATDVANNRFMTRAVDIVRALEASEGFRQLEARRGMDYHRRRPQSVLHTSPRKPAVEVVGPRTTFYAFGEQVEPEANENHVHDLLTTGMLALHPAMHDLRGLLPKAIRAEKYQYIF